MFRRVGRRFAVLCCEVEQFGRRDGFPLCLASSVCCAGEGPVEPALGGKGCGDSRDGLDGVVSAEAAEMVDHFVPHEICVERFERL